MKALTGRSIFLCVVVGAVLWIGYAARSVVTPLLAALLFAYILDPVVRRVERLGLARSAASALVVALAFGAVATAAALTATRLLAEARSFYDDVVGEPAVEAASEAEARLRLAADLGPDVRDEPVLEAAWDGRTLWFADLDRNGEFRPGIAREGFARLRREAGGSEWRAVIQHQLEATEGLGTTLAQSAGRWLSGIADAGQSAARTTLGILTLAILFPIYLYYSLAKLSNVYDVTVRHVPAAHRERVVRILADVHTTLSAFFRGRLILLAIRYVVLLPLFLAVGVPFGGVCALFNAVASLVPVLGSVAGAVVPLLLLLAREGSTAGPVYVLVAAVVVYEVVDQYVLTPAVIGKRVGLHALTILVATFIAGDLLGIFGMLVAIPLTAVLKILWMEFVLPEIRKNAEESPGGDAAL